ncbi:MFS transporter [Mucilaginibacter sp. Bleaf8]|uniref:MDR family MFS transporter n=1 Tax=Mucilaginibacter sp. Bleaf8 TaxID=2834430 RepID=UPI001BD15C61|nr:MFS transporter [Mucilaginibacter sp. Bleaf8]MBS7563704.1 MFS transporter [Mucilaginibacter sp. Bleaf8]
MISYTIKLYKDAYHGLSRNSWYLSLVMLVNRSGTMVVPFMTIYCTQQLHFSIIQAGIIMALFGAGALTGAFIGGKITDKYGFYDVQVGALLSGGLLFMLLGLQQSFAGICIVTFILSLCNDSFRPANSTAIAHYSTDASRTRSYSLNRLAVNLGWACGGALGGFLASVNYHLLFWVDGCTNILSAVLLLILMPRSVYKKPVAIKTHEPQQVQSPYRDGEYLTFIALTALFGACFFQLFTMQPVFYKSQWHLNEQFIGFLMALNGVLIIIVEMILVQRLEGRRPALNYISAGVLVSGIGFAILNTMPPGIWTALFVVLLITLGEILSMPFMNAFWIARTTNNNRGGYAALYSMAWSIAQIIAPALGSQLILHGGYDLLWWVLGGTCLVTSVGFIWLYKFRNQTPLAGKLAN